MRGTNGGWGKTKKGGAEAEEGDRERGEKNLINVMGGVFGEGEGRGI